MSGKRNAPGREAEGVECLRAGDFDAYATDTLRLQYLRRRGIPFNRAGLVASLVFGEMAHV